MASSLAPIAETWPENVLTSIVSRKLLTQKIRLVRIIYLCPDGFSARSAIFCRYWTCSFSGRNNQAIGPRLSAIFTTLFQLLVAKIGSNAKPCKILGYFAG